MLTIGNSIAAMLGTASAARSQATETAVVTMADQELPFDSYWSKN